MNMNGILETKNYVDFTVEGEHVTGAIEAKALPGDIVQTRDGVVVEIIDRTAHTSIVGVLEVASKYKYGFTTRNRPIYLFKPFSSAYPPFIVGTSWASTAKNVLATIDFETWTGNLPRGNSTRILGPCGDQEAEEEALLIHACPHTWSRKWIEPLKPALQPAAIVVATGRTFHVDPPGCKDIDDAITIVERADGSAELSIHIADVASRLQTNPWLWRAALIGQSLYKDGALVKSMFPPEMEAACSLTPDLPRRVITLCVTWAGGVLSDPQWRLEEIVVKESYTYDTVLDSEWARPLQAIASYLAGAPVTDSHDWIAQLMLFYNKHAAGSLRAAVKGVLRRHSPPAAERLEALSRLGAKVPAYLAFNAGEYCAADDPYVHHWGLETECYCHATSPVRRWADCVNQIGLYACVFGNVMEAPCNIGALNRSATKAKTFEREVFFLRALLSPSTDIAGCIVEVAEGKIRMWVDAWKRIVSVKTPLAGWSFDPREGLDVMGSIYKDPAGRNWKHRIVYSLQAAGPKN